MVIVGHMSSKSAFGAKNTGQKFLTPKNFWWCRNVCHDSCPGVIFGAGQRPLFPGRGGAELKIIGAGAAPGSHFPRGRGGACIPGNHVYYVFSPNLILLQIPPLLSLTINAYSPYKKLKVINLVQHFSSHQWKGKNIRNTASTHSATLFTMKKDWVLHISNGTNIGFFGEIKSLVRDG